LELDLAVAKFFYSNNTPFVRVDHPKFGSCVSLNGRNYVVAANDAGILSKTAEFCAEDAKKCIAAIQEKYDKQVFAICTDNESKMRLMRDILSNEFPELLTYEDPAKIDQALAKK
jgi:hypothetical protein